MSETEQKKCDATGDGGMTCDLDFKHGIVHSCIIEGRRWFWGHKLAGDALVMAALAEHDPEHRKGLP